MKLTTLICTLFLLASVQSRCPRKGSCHHQQQQDLNILQSCYDCGDDKSPIKLIQPQRGFGSSFRVVCDHSYEGGGWIVIQRRFNGAVDFYRGWKDYEQGFGDLKGEFWLGLKRIHELTYSKRYELHVLLEDWDGKSVVAKYDRFLVAGAEEKYRLRSLGKYSGTAGDSLRKHENMGFSTLDADNDKWKQKQCSREYYGAWWYENCHASNLNGLYLKGKVKEHSIAMIWKTFRGLSYGLKSSQMLIREVDLRAVDCRKEKNDDYDDYDD